jgi:hypothetical protein
MRHLIAFHYKLVGNNVSLEQAYNLLYNRLKLETINRKCGNMLKGILIAGLIIIMVSMVAYALPTGFTGNDNSCSNNNNGRMHNNNPRDNDPHHQPNPRDNHDNHGPNDNTGDHPGDNRHVVPEPSTLILLGIGALGMSAYRKIRK